jgi:hypothetical protein
MTLARSALRSLPAPRWDGSGVSMTTELLLLGTAGAPMPVAGGAGIASALVVEGRVFVIVCGRGAPSAFVEAGLDFTRLEAVFLGHLHRPRRRSLPLVMRHSAGRRPFTRNGPFPE